jgi:hypothetical protein
VPTGVAVDTSGNGYTSVYGSGVYQQKLLSPTPTSGYGPLTLVIHCPTLGQITGDNRANLVVVDAGQGVVFKEPTGQPFVDCGPSVYGNSNALIATGLSQPRFVATDALGDVFVDTNSSQLLKEVPSGSGYTQSVVTTLSGIASITGIGMSYAQTGGSYFGYVYSRRKFNRGLCRDSIWWELFPEYCLQGLSSVSTRHRCRFKRQCFRGEYRE